MLSTDTRLAALASERLGRPVALQGPLRVVLLPQPMIEADEVHLGQDEGGLGVKAQTLRLRLGLAPLLLGRLEARDLVLVGADIRLPWPLPAAGAWRPPPWLSDFAARIEASRVTLGEVAFENVAARLVAPGPLDAVRMEGSFTRAAAALGVTQSALSQAISGLEKGLRIRLLARTTRSVSPTAAGERLLQAIGHRFDEIEAELEALTELRDKPAGTVRITCTDHALRTLLMPKKKSRR